MYNFTTSEIIDRYISDKDIEQQKISGRIIEINCLPDLLFWERTKVFINCTFIFSANLMQTPKEKRKLHLRLAAGCSFVSFLPELDDIQIKIGTWLYGAEFSGTDWVVFPYMIHGGTSYSGYTSTVSIGEHLHMYDVRELVVQWAVEAEENYNRFFYKKQLYSFGRNTFAAGVELELPIDNNRFNRCTTIDKKQWFGTIDGSQIRGDLEVVSKPWSLQHIASEGFKQKIRHLYTQLEVPSEQSYYTSTDVGSRGSGIHVHISWHKKAANLLDSQRLRTAYYNILQDLGGEDFCLAKGGKSPKQFREYSPYRINDGRTCKYDVVFPVEETHVELRWLANHPDPEVVSGRIKLAVDIFKRAVVESMKQTIFTTASASLCKTYPQLTLSKKPLAEPLKTAPAPQPAPAAWSDLLALAQLFSH